MLVETIMTTPVLSVKTGATIGEAAEAMLARGISGLPVVDEAGALAGIVTEGDLLRRSELGTERKRPRWLQSFTGPGRAADEYVQSHGRKVSEVMSSEVVTASPETTLAAAVDIMTRRRIKRLPVLKDGKLVGIIARSDILRALGRTLRTTQLDGATDVAIREAIEAELSKQTWSGKGMIRVEVDHGTVTLAGMILDEPARLAAKVVAENTPGVMAVSDDLIWIEPLSGTVILGSGDYVAPNRPII